MWFLAASSCSITTIANQSRRLVRKTDRESCGCPDGYRWVGIALMSTTDLQGTN